MRMVSLSATFQAARGAVGADSEERAARVLGAVHLKSSVGEIVDRPLAIITVGDLFDWSVVSGGAQYNMRPSGQLYLFLTQWTNPKYYEDRVSAEIDATNFFFGVQEDIISLSCVDDPNSQFGESHIPITAMPSLGYGEVPEVEWPTIGRYYDCGFTVEWGDD